MKQGLSLAPPLFFFHAPDSEPTCTTVIVRLSKYAGLSKENNKNKPNTLTQKVEKPFKIIVFLLQSNRPFKNVSRLDNQQTSVALSALVAIRNSFIA